MTFNTKLITILALILLLILLYCLPLAIILKAYHFYIFLIDITINFLKYVILAIIDRLNLSPTDLPWELRREIYDPGFPPDFPGRGGETAAAERQNIPDCKVEPINPDISNNPNRSSGPSNGPGPSDIPENRLYNSSSWLDYVSVDWIKLGEDLLIFTLLAAYDKAGVLVTLIGSIPTLVAAAEASAHASALAEASAQAAAAVAQEAASSAQSSVEIIKQITSTVAQTVTEQAAGDAASRIITKP